MSIVVNKLDRSDLRRMRRYMSPTFEVIVECEMFRSLDVSIGGVHLDGLCEGLTVGSLVEGWIALPGLARAFAFSGEILRTDTSTGNTVVRFDDIEPDTAEFLDEAVARRLH
ncbi:MAG TPA: PilZ domain-containing protein [Stellaceae bacterium]|nr:PilZ domain-containing protein [Stellaceae bacterium]